MVTSISPYCVKNRSLFTTRRAFCSPPSPQCSFFSSIKTSLSSALPDVLSVPFWPVSATAKGWDRPVEGTSQPAARYVDLLSTLLSSLSTALSRKPVDFKPHAPNTKANPTSGLPFAIKSPTYEPEPQEEPQKGPSSRRRTNLHKVNLFPPAEKQSLWTSPVDATGIASRADPLEALLFLAHTKVLCLKSFVAAADYAGGGAGVLPVLEDAASAAGDVVIML